MKTLLAVVTAAVLGALLGAGTTWARLGQAPDASADYDVLLSATSSRAAKRTDGPQPKAVVETSEHDFGTVPRNGVVDHSFVVKNDGQAPLELRSGGTTCMKCTVSKLPKDPIQPGESADIVVQYNAAIETSHFRQSATILTNDPLTPRVVLTVSGQVGSSYRVVPGELVFSKLSATESRTALVRITSYADKDFAIESHTLGDVDSAAHFEVQITPVDGANIKDEPDAQRAFQLSVTVLPGLPLGPIRQKVILHTNLANQPTIVVPVQGSIESDITLAGPGWDREAGVLSLGVVKSVQGITRKLTILVHGGQRHDLQIKVGKCSPAFLEAEVGEPADIGNGAVVRYPLTVRVPPGSPAANHFSAPGQPGQIILETTHPDARQVRLLVQFAVEN